MFEVREQGKKWGKGSSERSGKGSSERRGKGSSERKWEKEVVRGNGKKK